MEEGYGGLRTVGVGRPGELAIPEPTEERPIRYRITCSRDSNATKAAPNASST